MKTRIVRYRASECKEIVFTNGQGVVLFPDWVARHEDTGARLGDPTVAVKRPGTLGKGIVLTIFLVSASASFVCHFL